MVLEDDARTGDRYGDDGEGLGQGEGLTEEGRLGVRGRDAAVLVTEHGCLVVETCELPASVSVCCGDVWIGKYLGSAVPCQCRRVRTRSCGVWVSVGSRLLRLRTRRPTYTFVLRRGIFNFQIWSSVDPRSSQVKCNKTTAFRLTTHAASPPYTGSNTATQPQTRPGAAAGPVCRPCWSRCLQ